MLGLPNQTLEILKDSVSKVIKLNPEHISVYSLILEEGTVLQKLVESKRQELPSEDTERKMYWDTKKMLEENGYIHYEISNFAKEGYFSRHNSDCWEQKEYIGFGLSAHSYIDRKRFSNTEDLKKYIDNINCSNFAQNVILCENQNDMDVKKEYMLLGLRTLKGVCISKYKLKFNDNPIFTFKDELNKLIANDLLKVDGDYIRLTSRGLDFGNIVWQEFV